MKKNRIISIAISVIACLLPMILGAILYNKLPERMPIHFNVSNTPDNYASKEFALFGLPIIMAIVQLICCIASECRIKDKEKLPIILKIFQVYIPILTIVIYFLMIVATLGITEYVGKVVCLTLGILFVLIGNYTPKMSYELGRKMINPVPKDEKSFRKMVRIMGYSFVVMGIILLVLVFFV